MFAIGFVKRDYRSRGLVELNEYWTIEHADLKKKACTVTDMLRQLSTEADPILTKEGEVAIPNCTVHAHVVIRRRREDFFTVIYTVHTV